MKLINLKNVNKGYQQQQQKIKTVVTELLYQ